MFSERINCTGFHGRATTVVLQVDQMGSINHPCHRLSALRRSLLFLVAWLLHFAVVSGQEQNAELYLPPLTVPEVPQASEPILPAPGYWLVSSWRSPQDFSQGLLRFCPEVTRYDEYVGYRHTGMDELTQSLIPGVPVCIVVHGSFMDSASVHPESRETWRWLNAGSCGLPVQMIYFSWPSDRSLSALASIDVAILGSRASRNGFYLANLIQSVPPECPVCLVGHSHGTRVISSSLHLLGGGVVEGHRHSNPGCQGKRIRAVFTAAAIDHDWLNPGERFERALCCVECLINLKNPDDPALMIYPLRRIGSGRALGCAGFTSKDRQELGSWNTRVKDWDVSDSIGAGHLWPNYSDRPWLARRLRNYLYFADSQHFPTLAESSQVLVTE